MNKVFALKNYSINGSSSGAAFPTIVKSIKGMGFEKLSFYGAVLDNNMEVKHKRFEGLEYLSELQGSKYVQSKIGESYLKVYDDLKNNYAVIFSGTPCQVKGLKNFLEIKKCNTEKLFLIDIVCHGTPSSLLWKKYVAWIEEIYSSKLSKFYFRYQEAVWKEYPSKAIFHNGKEYVNTYDVKMYNSVFSTNLALRESCYVCLYAKNERYSDLTIGDFWGIETLIPEFGEKESVSQILVNSEKGTRVIECVKALNDDIKIIEYKKKDYLKYQRNLNNPSEKPSKANEFKKDLINLNFDMLLKKYMDYGIMKKIKFDVKRWIKEHK